MRTTPREEVDKNAPVCGCECRGGEVNSRLVSWHTQIVLTWKLSRAVFTRGNFLPRPARGRVSVDVSARRAGSRLLPRARTAYERLSACSSAARADSPRLLRRGFRSDGTFCERRWRSGSRPRDASRGRAVPRCERPDRRRAVLRVEPAARPRRCVVPVRDRQSVPQRRPAAGHHR